MHIRYVNLESACSGLSFMDRKVVDPENYIRRLHV